MAKKKVQHKPVKLILEDLGGNGFHVFINVKVNEVRCRFLVDTGASKSVIDLDFFSKKFGKKNLKTIQQQTTGLHSSTDESYLAKIKTLSVGTMMNKNYIVAAVDLGHVNATYKQIGKKKIHGILGSDLMVKDKMVLDYPNLVITYMG